MINLLPSAVFSLADLEFVTIEMTFFEFKIISYFVLCSVLMDCCSTGQAHREGGVGGKLPQALRRLRGSVVAQK